MAKFAKTRVAIFEQILMRNRISRAEAVVTYGESKRKTIEKRTVKCSVLLRTVFKNQELRALRRRRKIREHFGVLVFFIFAHLQILRLYCKLKAPEGKEGALYGKVHQTKRNYLRTQR